MVVNDIMTKECITITKEKTINDAAALMMKYRIHGVPVVDEAGKLIGIVTETDFISKDKSKIALGEFVKADFKKTLEANRSDEKTILVADIMSKPCFTVDPYFLVEDLMPLFAEKKFVTVPVILAENELVGVVTVSDMVRIFNV